MQRPCTRGLCKTKTMKLYGRAGGSGAVVSNVIVRFKRRRYRLCEDVCLRESLSLIRSRFWGGVEGTSCAGLQATGLKSFGSNAYKYVPWHVVLRLTFLDVPATSHRPRSPTVPRPCYGVSARNRGYTVRNTRRRFDVASDSNFTPVAGQTVLPKTINEVRDTGPINPGNATVDNDRPSNNYNSNVLQVCPGSR